MKGGLAKASNVVSADLKEEILGQLRFSRPDCHKGAHWRPVVPPPLLREDTPAIQFLNERKTCLMSFFVENAVVVACIYLMNRGLCQVASGAVGVSGTLAALSMNGSSDLSELTTPSV